MRTRRRLGALLVLVAAVLALSGPLVADAQESSSTPKLAVRSVDGSDPDAVAVEFLFTGDRDTVGDLVVRENGSVVEHTAPVRLDETRDFGIVLAIDNSGSMDENGAFAKARAAAVDFVRAKAPSDQVAVVAFNSTATVIQRFTSDTDTLVDAIEGLGAGGGTAMYDAIADSVALFAGLDLVPNIILLTDGADSDSTTSIGVAQGLLDDAGALLYTIGLETSELDTDALSQLAAGTGGLVETLPPDARLSDVYLDVQSSMRQQFRTTFVSESERTGLQDLTLTVGAASASATYQVGARLDSAQQVQPIPAPEPGGISALQSGPFLWIGLLLIVAATAGGLFAVVTALTGDDTGLDSLLRPYAEGYVAPDPDDDSMVTSALLQRAVDLTGQFAERGGLLQWVEVQLQRADLPLRAREALFFTLAAIVLAFVLVAVLAGSVVVGLIVAVVMALVPPAILAQLAARRRRRFNEALPDTLHLLASTLRAGYSLMQGVESAAREAAEPMASELQRVVTESRLGMPLEQALDGVTVRTESRDFEWAVMAIRIQREVGGNLAELLTTVADTMLERERLRRDVRSLTAEGRVSAIVLGILPLGLGAAMFAINPDYMGSLVDDSFGLALLVSSLVLMGVGFVWMNKMIDIEV